MPVLAELSAAVGGVARRTATSVAGIGARHRGAAVVIAPDRVLTNAHNLRGETATVRFDDGRSEQGRVLGVDWDGDLAVIEVATGGASPLAWADAPAAVGDAVFAVAATPSGRARVTLGFVSAVEQAFRGPGGRRIAGSIEHTAPLAPGSSGSALVDAEGRLVGLNANRIGSGFYQALPATPELRARVDALGRGEAPRRPRLGVAVAPSRVARRLRRSVGLPDRDGVLVRDVVPDSPAGRAGVEPGDLIVEAGGIAVADADALADALARTGSPMELRLVRGVEERVVSVSTDPAPGGAPVG